MKNNMWKKGLVLGIIVLFVGASVIPSITGYDKDVEKIDYFLNKNEINNLDERDIKNSSYIFGNKESTYRNNNEFDIDITSSPSNPPENPPEWVCTMDDEIFAVSISANGEYIVVGSGSKVYFFTKNNFDPEWSYDTERTVESVSISDDGEFIAAGSHEQKKAYIYRFNKENSEPNLIYEIDALDRCSFNLVSVSMSANGEYMVIGTCEPCTMGPIYGQVYCFHNDDTSPNWHCFVSNGILSISTGGEYIVAGGEGRSKPMSGAVFLFHKDTGFQWQYWHDSHNNFPSVSISGDGEYITAGSNDFKLYFFQKDNSTPTWTYDTGSTVNSVSISADGDYIVAGSSKIYVFNKDNNTPIWSYDTGSAIQSVSISADGFFITAGNYYGELYFFYKDIDIPLWVCDVISNPPNKPNKPSGPTSGQIGVEYTYTSSTTDPDGNQLYYWFDWDDGTNSNWVGPYDSGATASAEHSWYKKDTYNIRVKARDTYGAESNWSDPLPIMIPKNKNSMMKIEGIMNLLQRILQTIKQRTFSQVNHNDKLILSSSGINPFSHLDSSINSVSISEDGEYIAAGCGNQNLYFFHSWKELVDYVLDNNTCNNIIPAVYAIIYDPSGDSSKASILKSTINRIGYSFNLDVGVGVSIEAEASFFGEDEINVSADASMTHSSSNDVFIEYSLTESLSTPTGGPKYMVGPGHGDTYWIEEWNIIYQLVNRTISFDDDIIITFPVFKYGMFRKCVRFLTVDYIDKNYPEPWRSHLLDLDISLDNTISGQELPFVRYGDTYNFITGPTAEKERSITEYTSRSTSFGMYVTISAADSLGFDFEVVSGMAKITMLMDFGATMTAYSTNTSHKSYSFSLQDSNQCADGGYDEIWLDCYEDKVFGTYLIITDESSSKTSQPHEYWTQKSDTIPPDVDITNPSNGQQVQGTVYVTVEISDNDDYFDYQILIDDVPKYNISTNQQTIIWPWDSIYYDNGPHTIKAKVTDTSGNTGEDEIMVIVNN